MKFEGKTTEKEITINLIGGFEKGDIVYDAVRQLSGKVVKVWYKSHLEKDDNKMFFRASFEYSIQPRQLSLNSFKAKEHELERVYADEVGDEFTKSGSMCIRSEIAF